MDKKAILLPWSWLCAVMLSLLAAISGMVFDYLARATLSLIKTGSFEVYVSPLIFKGFLPVSFVIGLVSIWLCRKSNQLRLIEQISIILTVIPVLGFLLLMAVAV